MVIARSFFPLMISLLLTSSCNNESDESSPYSELLSHPPYSKLTDSIRQNSSNPDLYYRRGVLLYKNNNNPPALADLRKAWSLSKKEIYAVNIINIFLQEKPDSAVAFAGRALSDLPGSVPLQMELVQAFADQGKTAEALRACDQILEKHPDQVAVLMMRSDLLEQQNDSVASLRTLERAYQIAPANEELCYNLAFKYAQGRNAKALSLCDSLLKNDTISKKAEPYYFKGIYYSNINDKSKALDYFNRAIQNDYNFLDAYMDKGRILYEQRKFKDGASVFQLALKISATYADAYYWLGRCQESMGQKEEAKQNYQRAYGLDKSLTEAKDAADKL